ncbi:MAG: hypothetical protein IKE60_34800 [Reyranella sp.]|uniref:hypothetical protein n=1 Tax=Reyranella sp. TaxID=1929291 RepID=UPI0025F1366D|nr:hypothetical protein [Reyranella sp.]MBR2819891.1 hypothetical protein [Reyranella sp.]
MATGLSETAEEMPFRCRRLAAIGEDCFAFEAGAHASRQSDVDDSDSSKGSAKRRKQGRYDERWRDRLSWDVRFGAGALR